MLALDLGVFNRRVHTVTFREALGWSAMWIALASAFAVLVYFWHGRTESLEFATGYVIELSLSIDNLFVFLVIFRFFRVPSELQHRVLFWGILGALITRGIFILAGVSLIRSLSLAHLRLRRDAGLQRAQAVAARRRGSRSGTQSAAQVVSQVDPGYGGL